MVLKSLNQRKPVGNNANPVNTPETCHVSKHQGYYRQFSNAAAASRSRLVLKSKPLQAPTSASSPRLHSLPQISQLDYNYENPKKHKSIAEKNRMNKIF
ncbi:hypothetical protein SCA6_001608 [Theobroma cacao]